MDEANVLMNCWGPFGRNEQSERESVAIYSMSVRN